MKKIVVEKNLLPAIFVDLDGVLIKHGNPRTWNDPFVVLPGVLDALREWWERGARIIITTGRPECNRARTVCQLADVGIFYHQLLMDIGSGRRYLINDTKPYDPIQPTAIAINLKRDDGLTSFKLELPRTFAPRSGNESPRRAIGAWRNSMARIK